MALNGRLQGIKSLSSSDSRLSVCAQPGGKSVRNRTQAKNSGCFFWRHLADANRAPALLAKYIALSALSTSGQGNSVSYGRQLGRQQGAYPPLAPLEGR